MLEKRSPNLHTAMFVWMAPFLVITAGVCAYLTYERVYAIILHGFERKLAAAADTTSVFIRGEDHQTLMSMSTASDQDSEHPAEESELYRSYSSPMQRIMRDSDLTYHYTIVLKDKTTIAYGIDATSGEDHSYLGTEEENPQEEAERLWRASKVGTVSISPIQEFDLWGKLKIANAPIRNAQHEIVGLVGADVNISVIDKKTRVAFLQVLGAGVLTLLLAGLMTWLVARRLATPLRNLKDAALKIGGGLFDYDLKNIEQPELQPLTQTLQQLSTTLQDDAAAGSNIKVYPNENNLDSICEPEPLPMMHPAIEKLDEQHTTDFGERLTFLRSFAPFKELDEFTLQVIAQAAEPITYRPNAVIAIKGTIPQQVLLVEHGEVIGSDSQDVSGMVGFDAILLGTPLPDDLRAGAQPLTCLSLERDHVFTMLHECPEMLARTLQSHIEERG